MSETFQITREQAEAYEELFVPALFAQWAPLMIDIARIQEGQRVLDVACGTGVVARAAADRVGRTGSVVGLDLNPAMLEVAANTRSDIEWRRGDAMNLPFGENEFDAVLCQSALFFFPNVEVAVAEMAGSVENLIEIEVKGTPLADRLSDDQISQILAESTGIFAKFLTPAGELQMPIRAHLVMGRKL